LEWVELGERKREKVREREKRERRRRKRETSAYAKREPERRPSSFIVVSDPETLLLSRCNMPPLPNSVSAHALFSLQFYWLEDVLQGQLRQGEGGKTRRWRRMRAEKQGRTNESGDIFKAKPWRSREETVFSSRPSLAPSHATNPSPLFYELLSHVELAAVSIRERGNGCGEQRSEAKENGLKRKKANGRVVVAVDCLLTTTKRTSTISSPQRLTGSCAMASPSASASRKNATLIA